MRAGVWGREGLGERVGGRRGEFSSSRGVSLDAGSLHFLRGPLLLRGNSTDLLALTQSPAEIVAATGAGKTAGLTIFRVCPRLTRRAILAELTSLVPQRQIYPTSRRALHLPSTAAPSSDPSLEPTAFVPTVGLWRLKLAPRAMSDGEATEEVWVGSDKERTLVRRRSLASDSSLVLSARALIESFRPCIAQFYRPYPGSTPATTAALQLVHDEPDVSTLAAFTMAGGQVVVTVSREAINVYDQGALASTSNGLRGLTSPPCCAQT